MEQLSVPFGGRSHAVVLLEFVGKSSRRWLAIAQGFL